MITQIIKKLENFDIFFRLNRINIKIKQIGGDDNFKFRYKDKIIKFKKYIDKEKNIEIYLKTIDKKNNCLVITIDYNSKIGYIKTINSVFGECLKGNRITNNGATYIKISIALLKKYKNNFKINKIILSDDALFYCDKQTIINMSMLNFLQHGDSYYGRFGFIPFKNIDKEGYKLNQNKIIKIKTKKINIKKLLDNYTKSIEANLIIKLNKKYIKYKDKLFQKWFNKISKILSFENCDLLSYLVERIFLFELKFYPITNMLYEMKL